MGISSGKKQQIFAAVQILLIIGVVLRRLFFTIYGMWVLIHESANRH